MAMYQVAEIYATVIFAQTGLPDSEYDTPISTAVYSNFVVNFWNIIDRIISVIFWPFRVI
jgi:hypothetical protein